MNTLIYQRKPTWNLLNQYLSKERTHGQYQMLISLDADDDDDDDDHSFVNAFLKARQMMKPLTLTHVQVISKWFSL
jgi:hypothetical protein